MPSRRLAMAAVAVAAFGAASLGGANAALAGALADEADRAEQFLYDGRAAAALAAFDKAVSAFWEETPLQFRAASFVEPVQGIGPYQRHGGTFHTGDTARVHLAPVGYGFIAAGDSYRVTFATGIEIRSPGGLVFAKTDDFGDVSWQGPNRSREVNVDIDVALPTLKAGSYVLRLSLADRASAKAATLDLPFTIAE